MEVKKLLIFFLKAIVVVAIIDFLVGKALENVYDRMETGERARAHYVINKCDADLLIFGSSRAFLHYNPKTLSDSLQCKVYNAGRPAQTILYHVTLLKMVLERYKPPTIILDVNENELVYEDRKYDILNSLLPYYKSESAVKQLINEVKPAFRFFSWSNCLPYNSSFFAILYRGIFDKESGKDLNGYIPNRGHHKEPILMEDNCESTLEMDDRLQQALDEFITICQENDIRLYLIISPRFTNFKCPRTDHGAVIATFERLKVPYYDFSGSDEFKNNIRYFNDAAHLNYEGSVFFSQQIVKIIKKNGYGRR